MRENEIKPCEPNEEPNGEIRDLAASFQFSIVRQLVGTLEKLAIEHEPRTVIVAGGVACNKALRAAANKLGEKLRIPVYFPSPHLSTDNAAMIAAAGTAHLKRGERAGLDLNADVTIRLQNLEVEDAMLKKTRVRYRL